jgi:hypothetical protein
MWGWANDAAFLIPLATGFLTASIGIGWLTRSGHGLIRAFCVLLFAAAIGFGVGGLATLLQMGVNQEALLAVGSGLVTAALGLMISFYRLPYVFWRLAASLFAGIGSGLFIAGLAHSDVMGVFLGVGTGFLICGLTAFTLFFGLLSPVRQRERQPARLHATQVWADAGAEMTSESVRKVPRGLIVAAVVLGSILAALFVVYLGVPTESLSSFHACSVAGCRNPATVVFSKEFSAGSTLFDRKDYCETHARQGAWEAQQSGRKFGVFDIATGQPRPEFAASGDARKE